LQPVFVFDAGLFKLPIIHSIRKLNQPIKLLHMKILNSFLALFLSATMLTAQSNCLRDTLIRLEDMPVFNSAVSAAVYNGEIYTFGGFTTTGGPIQNSSFKYNVSNGVWSQLAPMPSPRGEVGVAELNGIIYCMGGWTGNIESDRNHAYNIATGTWSVKANLPFRMASNDAVAYNGKIYLVGGIVENPASFFIEYTPETNLYRVLSPPLRTRRNAKLIVYQDRFYLLGGQYDHGLDRFVTDQVEEYNPQTEVWTQKAPMPLGLQHYGASLINGKIHVICGASTGWPVPNLVLHPTHYVYDIATDTWSQKSDLPFSLFALETAVYNDELYIFGGNPSSSSFSNQCHKITCVEWEGLVQQRETLAEHTGIKIYPNPVYENLTINTGIYATLRGYSIRVCNDQGQKVHEIQLTQQLHDIDVKKLGRSGAYIVYFVSPEGRIAETKKVIVVVK